ncbi:MAG: PQQ-binding-like beta-propeller repeat protein [Ignavibacteria bacterium]|nr:PQQ-binding-like beta-propeller repeat protein [Ignavibacteria bacterium]
MFLKKLILFFTLSFLISSCASLSIDKRVEVDEKEDWLFIGGDLAKTNVSKSTSILNPPFYLYWQYNMDGGLAKSCLSVSDAILFANTLNGEFYAIDIASGKSLGRASTSGKASFSTPVIFGNNIIITSSGDRKSNIFCYNLITGLVKWEKKIGWIESSPVKVGDDVVTGSVTGLLYRFNVKTGNLVWTTRPVDKKKFYGSFYTSPTILNNTIFAGNDDFNMYAFDLTYGKELWKFKTNGSIFSDAAGSDGKIFFGSDDKNFYCVDTSGNLVWKKDLKTKFLSSSTFYNDLIIISGIDGNVYGLDKKNGDVRWTFTTKGAITASPLVHKDNIFIGSYDTYFYCLNAADGRELWKYQCEGRIKTSAVVWKDYIFTASDEKFVYCFSKQEFQKRSSGKSLK